MGAMIKRALLFFFLSAPVFGASAIGVNNFSGLDTQDPSNSLSPNQSQDLLNVRLQPGGRSVSKRDGYGLFQSLGSGQPVHGGYHFQQTDGSDVQLWGSSTTLYSIVNDSTAVPIATGTLGATWQCTDNLGYAYCVTSAGDTPVKTDGTLANTTYESGIPAGTIIMSTPLQLVVSGVTGSLSTIYVSANNDFSNFTTGPLPTDSYAEIINAPGSRITHMGYYFGNIYWWTDRSDGYISGSATQGTVGITIISNQIGTLDNSSAFWNPTTYDQGNKFNTGTQTTSSGNPYFNEMSSLGGIFFRGQDGHIYQYDGYTLTRLSRIITPNILASSPRKLNSWTQSTSADFNGGYGSFIDTTTYPDQFQLSGSTDGFTSLSAWSGFWSVSGGIVTPPFSLSQLLIGHLTGTQNLSNGQVISNVYTQCAAGNNMASGVGLINDSGNGYLVNFGNVAGTVSMSFKKVVGSPTTTIPSTVVNTPVFDGTAYHNIEFEINYLTGELDSYYDGILVSSATDTTYTSGLNHQLLYSSADSTSRNVCTFKNASVISSSGTYYSAVNIAPNISSWVNLITNDSQVSGSSITYYSRSSFTPFVTTSPSPAWVPQTKNSIVSSPVGSYMQIRADMYAGQVSPVVYDFTLSWNENSQSDKCYISYFNDAILFAVSYGTTTLTNNRLFYLDLLNNTWLFDDIASNGFQIERNVLYLGDPLSDNVYRYGGFPTDNSLPIQSYWKSMDFSGQDPTVQNSFDQADFSFKESSSTVTFTYSVDNNPALTKSKSIPLFSSRTSLIKRGFALQQGEIGTYYNFMIGDNSSLPAWSMMGQRTLYNPLPWRPQESN